jgi:hypothetical protein
MNVELITVTDSSTATSTTTSLKTTAGKPVSSSSAGIGASASAAMPLTRCSAGPRGGWLLAFDHANHAAVRFWPPVVAAVAGGPIDTTDRYPPEVSYPATPVHARPTQPPSFRATRAPCRMAALEPRCEGRWAGSRSVPSGRDGTQGVATPAAAGPCCCTQVRSAPSPPPLAARCRMGSGRRGAVRAFAADLAGQPQYR